MLIPGNLQGLKSISCYQQAKTSEPQYSELFCIQFLTYLEYRNTFQLYGESLYSS